MNEGDFWKALQQEMTIAAIDISKLRAEIDDNDATAPFFLKRLMSACENATGCVILARANLSVPLGVVVRSLFESMISTFWASLSDENTRRAIDSEVAELMRIMRNNLRDGRAQIVHKETGKIETATILDHPELKNAKSPKKLSDMATEAGLRSIYDQLYGFLSMLAHGTSTEIIANSQLKEKPPVYEHMSLVRGCLKSIHLIAVNRIREGKLTPLVELENLLKVKLSA
jgi:hypothetical protein